LLLSDKGSASSPALPLEGNTAKEKFERLLSTHLLLEIRQYRDDEIAFMFDTDSDEEGGTRYRLVNALPILNLSLFL